MYPFERFTESAKRALMEAQREAEGAGHSWIGTEHLLLGLLRATDGVAAAALAATGVEPEQIREAISAAVPRGQPGEAQPILPTTRVRKVIEIAFAEALRSGRSHVGTDHLLIALSIEREGLAAQVLTTRGATRFKLEEAVAAARETVRERPGTPAPLQEVPVGKGARVLAHDPDPPYRLWEGRVVAVSEGRVVVEVADRPAGARLEVESILIHPIPTGPTLYCPYCVHL